MNGFETILLLLILLALLAILSNRARLPYPIVILLGGIAIGSLSDLSSLAISPEMILPVFLPPLLMQAAYFTSLRDFKDNLRHIFQLAVGLVFATSAAVAAAFVWLVPGASWALGFVIGAIVSPPDAIAAPTILKRMRLPRRILTLIEGESLVNDATGLVIYKFAVVAVVAAHFSLLEAGAHFLWMAISGIGIGLAMGFVHMRLLFPRIGEQAVEILSTILLPYAAYLLAEGVGGSGVLAVVAAGLVVSWLAPSTFRPQFRLPAETVWNMVVFTLSGVMFLLMGLQFPSVLARLADYAPATLFYYAAVICGVTVAVRFAWIFLAAYIARQTGRMRDAEFAWQNLFILSWTGMRGVVSLATALALPFMITGPAEFPHRDLIIFLAVSVIFFTLVLQGLTLPWLLSRLKLSHNTDSAYEDWAARKHATEAALNRIDQLWHNADELERPVLKRIYGYYLDRLHSLGDSPDDEGILQEHPLIQAENRIWQEAIAIEREQVIALRQKFAISDDVMRDILSEIDLLASRFAMDKDIKPLPG